MRNGYIYMCIVVGGGLLKKMKRAEWCPESDAIRAFDWNGLTFIFLLYFTIRATVMFYEALSTMKSGKAVMTGVAGKIERIVVG